MENANGNLTTKSNTPRNRQTYQTITMYENVTRAAVTLSLQNVNTQS